MSGKKASLGSNDEGELTGKSGEDSEDAGHCDSFVGRLVWMDVMSRVVDAGCFFDFRRWVLYTLR